MPKLIKLLVSLIISFSAAALGGLATASSVPTWYADLDKPFLNPPNQVFGPMWTFLYILIGISLYLVWTTETAQSKKQAYVIFGVQIGLNTLWSLIFFGLQIPWLAVAIIIALIVSIVWNMHVFWQFSRPASYLLIPYLLWVGFATYLTIGIAILN